MGPPQKDHVLCKSAYLPDTARQQREASAQPVNVRKTEKKPTDGTMETITVGSLNIRMHMFVHPERLRLVRNSTTAQTFAMNETRQSCGAKALH